MTEQIVVIKIGGSTLGRNDTSLTDLVDLHRQGARIVVIHGGGGEVSHWLTRHGREPEFINGLRVTRREELDVVTAILAGLVNKRLVLQMSAQGGRAVGVSGVDGACIEAEIRNEALGYVGEITKVNRAPLDALIDERFLPVISPICWGRHDGEPTLLNVNADDVAVQVAAALDASRLIYLTDVAGIMDDQRNVLAKVTARQVNELITTGTIAGGMVPKARACASASRHVDEARIIDGTVEHALLREFDRGTGGTSVVRDELA